MNKYINDFVLQKLRRVSKSVDINYTVYTTISKQRYKKNV